jgi:hypothetical protein
MALATNWMLKHISRNSQPKQALREAEQRDMVAFVRSLKKEIIE